MDRQTAHNTFRDHRPSGWLAAIGLNRCREGCGSWPCGPWLTARDQRDHTTTIDQIAAMAAQLRQQTAAGVAAMTDRIGTRPGDELAQYLRRPSNRGPG